MNSTKPNPNEPHESLLAPVALAREGDSVSHSLAILSTVYHYNHWIFDSFREFLGDDVVEVGAGVGNITQFLLNARRLVCLEPFDSYRAYLSQRFAQHANVTVLGHAIEHVPSEDVPAGAFDSTICLNVLEHIEDDHAALVNMRKLLKPGGRAIVLVPALQAIYGELDRAMGHHRRYSMSELKRKMAAASLKPRYARYSNLPGVLGWWWHGKIRKRTQIPTSTVKKFDRLVPLLSAMERIIPPLLGQSVLVIGEAC